MTNCPKCGSPAITTQQNGDWLAYFCKTCKSAGSKNLVAPIKAYKKITIKKRS